MKMCSLDYVVILNDSSKLTIEIFATGVWWMVKYTCCTYYYLLELEEVLFGWFDILGHGEFINYTL